MKSLRILALVAFAALTAPAFAQVKISAMPAASTPLDGSETVPLLQGGNNVIATTQDVADLASATPGGSTTQVQYNNAGAFAGDAGMTYSASTDTLTLLGNANVSGTMIFPNGSQSSPTSGSTTNMAAGKRYLYITPAGTIATYTVNLPSSPTDGQVVSLFTTQTITAITIGGQGGNTVTTNVTQLPANTGVDFMFFSGVWRQTTGIVVAAGASQTNATAFSMTCTGFASCPGTGNIYSYSKTGNIVCVQLAPFAGTSNSTSFQLQGLPAAALPATDGLSFAISAQDNTTRVLAWASVRTSGNIELYNGIAGNGQAGTWTASGTKGLGGGGLYSPICYATN